MKTPLGRVDSVAYTLLGCFFAWIAWRAEPPVPLPENLQDRLGVA